MPAVRDRSAQQLAEYSEYTPLVFSADDSQVLASMLMFGTLTALLMATFFDNSGGAWDNAKKYIEAGHHGGKGGDCHKAAVTGDTVGDPFKAYPRIALYI